MTVVFAWRRAIVAACAAAVGAGVMGVPAAAQEPNALGWWWVGRPSTMLPAVFSPTPDPPDGGLYVAEGPGGPTGVAALRFKLAPEVTDATLTLTIAEADGTPMIEACPPTEPWEAAENGGWDQRPQPDCETASVTGKMDAGGTRVSFSLRSLLGRDGVIDMMLVPGVSPEVGSSTGFAVSFAPPGASALAVTNPPDEPVVPVAPAPDPAPEPLAIPSFSAPADFGGPTTPAPPVDDVGGEMQRPPAIVAAGSVEPEGFIYSAVLMLPLVLLVSASFLGWTLTRPVVVTKKARP